MSLPLGPDPVRIRCPACHADIVTTVKSKPSTQTHIIALLMTIACCFLCAWIPYYRDSCQNRVHHCPNCDAYLGTYSNK